MSMDVGWLATVFEYMTVLSFVFSVRFHFGLAAVFECTAIFTIWMQCDRYQ